MPNFLSSRYLNSDHRHARAFHVSLHSLITRGSNFVLQRNTQYALSCQLVYIYMHVHSMFTPTVLIAPSRTFPPPLSCYTHIRCLVSFSYSHAFSVLLRMSPQPNFFTIYYQEGETVHPSHKLSGTPASAQTPVRFPPTDGAGAQYRTTPDFPRPSI